MGEFTLGLYFFEKIISAGLVTYTINANRYKYLLPSYIILALQQCHCLVGTTFMQHCVTLYMMKYIKDLLQRTFRNYRIISHDFSTDWPALSPNLNSCDFQLWEYLKNNVYCGGLTNLANLKARTVHHIHSIQLDTLRSI